MPAQISCDLQAFTRIQAGRAFEGESFVLQVADTIARDPAILSSRPAFRPAPSWGHGRVAAVASQGDTVEDARDNLKEALELFFECASSEEVARRLG